ncbi:MAG: DNA gyrase inhibitor YacG [Sphingomonadales bacterium]
MTGDNRKRRPCALCGAPAADKYRPFCSARCADIDLGRWFSERYVIAGDEAESQDNGDGTSEEF